ncbi:MAG TPA: DNA polymerase III subunit delta [Candidatus Doudnabacteria bacterium]|nr:DNA polymerase III subunit delta [Candidatus Doudnabacteria bacterium]
MLTLLLGDDVYAKQAFLDQELSKLDGDLSKFQGGGDMPKLTSLGGASLFGGAGVYLFVDCLKNYELEDLEVVAQNTVPIYFWESSLDKRLAKSKQLIKIATVKDFPAPERESAQAWLQSHSDILGIKIQPSAAGELVNRLFGSTKTNLPVMTAHQELLKLSSYAGEEAITTAMVEELTPQDLSIDMFALLDFIGSKNKAQAIKLLQNYYESSSEDDKALTIRLVALLSDQFRSLLIAKDLGAQGLSDQQILQSTGWKSGRLFVMNKIGRNFSSTQLQSALTKLYSLDKELKTSTLPPRVIVDMIVAVI